jgi:hypothetical protein
MKEHPLIDKNTPWKSSFQRQYFRVFGHMQVRLVVHKAQTNHSRRPTTGKVGGKGGLRLFLKDGQHHFVHTLVFGQVCPPCFHATASHLTSTLA